MQATSRNRTSTTKTVRYNSKRRECPVSSLRTSLDFSNRCFNPQLASPDKFSASAGVVFSKKCESLYFTKSENPIATIKGSLNHPSEFWVLFFPFRVLSHESQKTTGGSSPLTSTAALELT